MVRQQEPHYNTSNGGGGGGSGENELLNGGGFNETPLTELSNETRKQLGCMLNRKKMFRSENGEERDWRGIARLANLRNYFNEDIHNPMDQVLKCWCENSPETAKIGFLENFLGIIDRWDVCDDIQENLAKDTQRYKAKKRRQEQAREIIASPPETQYENNNNNYSHLDPDQTILTNQDVDCLNAGLPLPTYNACVLYADADLEFATQIMENLESPKYNFKLFLKNRDLLCGIAFEHMELTRLMATRCNHLIVVFTEEFNKSPENTFLVNFVQKIQIEKKTRKIIPIVMQNMTLPQNLDLYTKLVYSKNSSLYNFWDKLAKSLHDMDVLSIYQPKPIHSIAPTAPEPDEGLKLRTLPPETPRILLNDKEVFDMPDPHKVPNSYSYETPTVTINGVPSAVSMQPEPKSKKADKLLQKLTLNLGSTPKSPLRHAHSITGINMPERERTLSASSSNLSTTSETKKSSRKWRPPKMLKSMFSRSKKQLALEVPS